MAAIGRVEVKPETTVATVVPFVGQLACTNTAVVRAGTVNVPLALS